MYPSADEVRKANMATLADTHVVYIEAVRKILGEKGLKAMGEANRIHGLTLGESALSQGSLRKNDLSSIFKLFEAFHPYFGFELEIIDQTETKLELKVTACPWIESFRQRGANNDICDWVTRIDEGIGQVVDPDLKLTIPMCMMRGDMYCIYRWSKD